MEKKIKINSSCHCGALQLEIKAEAPSVLTSCNCSICYKYGSLMAYFNPSEVKVVSILESVDEYLWGDKSLSFIRCQVCGCYSHWKSLDPNQVKRMGVNARLFTNIEIDKIPIRHFDSADTWKFID